MSSTVGFMLDKRKMMVTNSNLTSLTSPKVLGGDAGIGLSQMQREKIKTGYNNNNNK